VSALSPGATIGLLGGGQLARMLTLAGTAMGFRFLVLDPTPGCPAALAGARPLVAPYDDPQALQELAASCARVTYEFENVPHSTAKWLEQHSDLPQGSSLLQTCQHRLREKTALQQLRIPVTPFQKIESLQELDAFFDEHGPTMLKTCTGGYDGKGQVRIEQRAECAPAFEHLGSSSQELLAEQIVTFEREASVLVARNRQGEVACYPAAENVHEQNILTFSRIPANLTNAQTQAAERIARQVAEGLKLVGMLGVELFVGPRDQVLVNELAPRPHNSGHWTQNAAATCQFEQHLRAIADWPLGSPRMLAPAVMLNLIGDQLPRLLTQLDQLPANMHLHLYGKPEVRPGRKMGHLNWLPEEVEAEWSTLSALDLWNPRVLNQLRPS
jgi:5-(carboxyamino)imidazole ribonucleotide synthase